MPLAAAAVPDADALRAELERRMAMAPAMLHSIDERGRLMFVSDAWLAKLGYTRDEVLGRLSSDFLTPESRTYAANVVLPEFFRTGRCENIEYQLVCKDGRVIDVLLSAVMDDAAPGGGRRSIAVITDVTAMKMTKRALAESEARYRFLAENTSDVIALLDRDGNRLYVSAACRTLTGFSPEEMMAMRTADSTHPDDCARVLAALQTNEGAFTISYRMRRKDFSYVWVETSCKPVEIDGRDDLRLVIVRNVDERVEARRREQDSEARYRLLAQNSTDMIVLLARDGTRHYVSPACIGLTGFTPEEMLKTRTGDMTHPEDYDRVVGLIRTMTEASTLRFRLQRKDGSYIWIEANLKPVEMDGSDDLLLAVVRNVDARIHAERALQESETRYRLLADNSGDLIMLITSDGTRTYASPACRKMLGYEPEEMLAIRSHEALHPDDVARVLGMLADGVINNQSTRYRMRRKDGSYVWVETTGHAIDIDGRSDLRLVIARDIDQRMRAEQQLKDSEARYRLLADNSSDMVFQLDRDMVRRYVSPACREILGFEPEELIGLKPVNMVHPDDAARLTLVYESLLNGTVERQAIVNRIRHRNGNWIWVEARFRALRDPDTGATVGILGALRDICARKAVEDELAEANRRLQTLADQDGLTGLANRRAFDEALAKEHLRARRERQELALIMIDVDRFKAFNDIYGHPAGDDCLRQVARAIATTIARPGDIAVRYGGEEFAVLLPNTDETGATVIAERISQAVLALALPHEANASGLVTISAGVAALVCLDGWPEALVLSADRALYRAKDFGRNAVIRASEVAPGTAMMSHAVA